MRQESLLATQRGSTREHRPERTGLTSDPNKAIARFLRQHRVVDAVALATRLIYRKRRGRNARADNGIRRKTVRQVVRAINNIKDSDLREQLDRDRNILLKYLPNTM